MAEGVVDLLWIPLGAGEMWNSNSVTSWLLARGGVDTTPLRPPDGGRAPGWQAGLTVAARDRDTRAGAGDRPPSGSTSSAAGRCPIIREG